MAIKTRAQLTTANTATFGNGKDTRGDDEKAFNKDWIDSCMLLAEGTYSIISLADWTALVTANGLVPGWRYRVTNFYTFDAFGTKDIVVTANGINTIETTGYVLFGDFYVPYTTDSAFNQGFFLYTYGSMALTGAQCLTYGSANFKFNVGIDFYIVNGGGSFFKSFVSGDDNATLYFNNCQSLNDNPGTWTAGDFGTYDPNTDTFTPNAGPCSPAITIDSTVVTSVTGILQASYSIVNNVISYSILFEGVTIDFTAGDEGWIKIEADQFKKIATAAQVVSGQFNEFFPVGIMAMAGRDYLQILLTDKTTTVTITDKYLSITGQCQA